MVRIRFRVCFAFGQNLFRVCVVSLFWIFEFRLCLGLRLALSLGVRFRASLGFVLAIAWCGVFVLDSLSFGFGFDSGFV